MSSPSGVSPLPHRTYCPPACSPRSTTRGPNPLAYSVENVGGRFIISTNLRGHRHRVRTIRPVVDTGMRWAQRSSTAHPPPQKGRHEVRLASRRLGGPCSSSSTPLYTPLHPSDSGVESGRKGKAQCPFSRRTLPPEQSALYNEMLKWMSTISREETKRLLQGLFRESEDHRLLACYGGAMPTVHPARGINSYPTNLKEEPQRVSVSPPLMDTANAAQTISAWKPSSPAHKDPAEKRSSSISSTKGSNVEELSFASSSS